MYPDFLHQVFMLVYLTIFISCWHLRFLNVCANTCLSLHTLAVIMAGSVQEQEHKIAQIKHNLYLRYLETDIEFLFL